MSPQPSITPPLPDITRPPCPGCPDPDNARRIDMPCPGPDKIEDPFRDALDEIDAQNLRSLAKALGAPACADMTFCPRTRGSRIAHPQ